MRSAIWIMLAVVVLGALVGLGNAANAQDPPTPTPGVDPIMMAGIEQTEARVLSLRGVEPPIGLQRSVLTTEAIIQNAQSRVATAYTVSDARFDMLFYSTFGFVQAGYDLYQQMQNLIPSIPAGYYDAGQNTIYLQYTGNSVLDPFSGILYAQNYVLAIQNTRSDVFIQRDAAIASNDMDRAMALNAVIQGDAQLTTQYYIQSLIDRGELNIETILNITGRSTSLDPNLPSIFLDELNFPAEAGTRFVRELYEETNTWRLVNLLYERLPLSTEQILHPTLYLLYEVPHVIELAPMDEFWEAQALNIEGWRLAHDRSLGEFYLRQHLGLFLDPENVDVAAAGWGGDRFMIYDNDRDERVLVWRLSWDSQQDFSEFNDIYPQFLDTWLASTADVLPNGVRCWLATRNTCMLALGEDLLIAQAPTYDMAINIIEFQRQQLLSARIFG